MELWGNRFLVMAVLTFVAVLLLIEGLYFLWLGWQGPRARKLRSRLEALTASRARAGAPALLKEGAAQEDQWLERMAQRLPRSEALAQLLAQSGLGWTPGRLLVLSVVAAAGAVIAVLVLRVPQPYSLLAPLAAAAGPAAYAAFRRERRMRRIEQQLPDALDLLCRGLRAGHAFASALKMAGDELQDPIASELRATHEEINFGIAPGQALTHLAQRVPSMDMRYFVVSVLINREAGGNLAEILGNLSRLIRERLKLMARVRVLSAEGRLSAWILVVMPFALGGIMLALNPDFMRPLFTDPLGITMIKTLLAMMLVGVVVLRRIVRIRV
ncbi:MAG: type II secretion system F family protein [Burkholderiales bacterium]|nr:type II secretion system F family protein [Burkholderiales bacterium]